MLVQLAFPSRGYRVRTPPNQAAVAVHSIGSADQLALARPTNVVARFILTRLNRIAGHGCRSSMLRIAIEEA
jgi:hypothetical protein